MSSSIVLIGPPDALVALRERFASGVEAHSFSDADILEAFEHILRAKPRIIVLDNHFAASSRGAALVSRISDDPSLGECEVRVIAHDHDADRVTVRRNGGPGTLEARAFDQRGTRRAPRWRARDGVEILVDGHVASLIDISSVGVQVVCVKTVKPNQRVRLALTDGRGTIRCNGSIAWASFEMAKGQPPRYRAGIELSGADPALIAAFAARQRQENSDQ